MTPLAVAVVALVVAARFLVPLAIPRRPVPALLAALVLDAVDQTIFQAVGADFDGYQGYDKPSTSTTSLSRMPPPCATGLPAWPSGSRGSSGTTASSGWRRSS